MTHDPAKLAAGTAAAALVEDGMRLGLGTGSTVAAFLDALAERGLDVAGVPTSEATAARCRELGIGLLDLESTDRVDLCVDGADELTRDLALTKGGGGALLREKVVASLADEFIVIASPDKVVDALGDTFALPVEVVPFAAAPVRRTLESHGFHVTVRGDGGYRTDNGNLILDARRDGGIVDVEDLALRLQAQPGVAEHGLFLGMATRALLGSADGAVWELTIP